MKLEPLIQQARKMGASDLHLEPGLPPAVRVRGKLRMLGEPCPAADLQSMVEQVVGEGGYPDFLRQRSSDLSRTLAGVRCRINALTTIRGVGLAVRLLPAVQPTVESLNLHPDLKKLVQRRHGLILLSGPTGCGKSSTMAALIEEINRAESQHIITIESPIEYLLTPKKAFIRQREVGRDTPSFDQALMDSLREDPDVLMVGELRDPLCMRMTLNAAETGHLVLSTVHSSNVAEALQRIVLAFPPEIQASITAQLAGCLVGVVCQKLGYHPELDLQIPECEVLLGTSSTRGVIRQGQFFKLPTILESSGAEGMWSFERYRAWIASRGGWNRPLEAPVEVASAELASLAPSRPGPRPAKEQKPTARPRPRQTTSPSVPQDSPPEDLAHPVLVIEEPEEDVQDLLAKLTKRRDRG